MIRGCKQQYGIDYQDTFSPVVSANALRCSFAIAARPNYLLVTLDIKAAFLYGDLEDTIYMLPPEDFNYKNKLCKLNKALYGLKQAPLKWNERFSNFLKEQGLEKLQTEHCIFKKRNSNLPYILSHIFLVIYS